MGGPGSGAVNQFYNLNNAPIATGGGFAWVLQQGNPNLQSEVADTYTWGLVVELGQQHDVVVRLVQDRHRRRHHAVLGDLRGLPLLRRKTVTTPAEAAAQAATPACQAVPRDLNNGRRVERLVSYDNQATISTSGMDVAWNWNFEGCR